MQKPAHQPDDLRQFLEMAQSVAIVLDILGHHHVACVLALAVSMIRIYFAE